MAPANTAVLEAVTGPSVAEDTAPCTERFTQCDWSLFILAFQLQADTFKGAAQAADLQPASLVSLPDTFISLGDLR